MGKLILFFFIVLFVIIFPFFIKVNHSQMSVKKITPLEIENGVIYNYENSLKEIIKFKQLLKDEELIKFFDISYLNLENNYSLKAKRAVYNIKNRVVTGKDYTFISSNIRGSGKSFKKIGDKIYASEDKFQIKE